MSATPAERTNHVCCMTFPCSWSCCWDTPAKSLPCSTVCMTSKSSICIMFGVQVVSRDTTGEPYRTYRKGLVRLKCHYMRLSDVKMLHAVSDGLAFLLYEPHPLFSRAGTPPSHTCSCSGANISSYLVLSLQGRWHVHQRRCCSKQLPLDFCHVKRLGVHSAGQPAARELAEQPYNRVNVQHIQHFSVTCMSAYQPGLAAGLLCQLSCTVRRHKLVVTGAHCVTS